MDGETRLVRGSDMSKEKAMVFRWSKICLLLVSSVLIAWLHATLIRDQISYSVLEGLYYTPLFLDL
jgi:hypothetical protein